VLGEDGLDQGFAVGEDRDTGTVAVYRVRDGLSVQGIPDEDAEQVGGVLVADEGRVRRGRVANVGPGFTAAGCTIEQHARARRTERRDPVPGVAGGDVALESGVVRADGHDPFAEAADRESADRDVAYLADDLTRHEVDVAEDADAVHVRGRARIAAGVLRGRCGRRQDRA